MSFTRQAESVINFGNWTNDTREWDSSDQLKFYIIPSKYFSSRPWNNLPNVSESLIAKMQNVMSHAKTTYYLLHKDTRNATHERACNTFPPKPLYLPYGMTCFIGSHPEFIKAVLKFYRNDPEGPFQPKEDLLFRGLKAVFGQQDLDPNVFMLSCSKEKSKKFRAIFNHFLSKSAIEKYKTEIEQITKDTIQQLIKHSVQPIDPQCFIRMHMAKINMLVFFGSTKDVEVIVCLFRNFIQELAGFVLKPDTITERQQKYLQSIIDQLYRFIPQDSLFMKKMGDASELEKKIMLLTVFQAGLDNPTMLLYYALTCKALHSDTMAKYSQDQVISEIARLCVPVSGVGRGVGPDGVTVIARNLSKQTQNVMELKQNERLSPNFNALSKDPSFHLARNSHRISRQVRQDVAPDLFTNIREHCPGDKARIFGDEDGVTDCLNCQRGCEKCGLDPYQFNPGRELPKGIPEDHFAFGSGKHLCPGKLLSIEVIKMFLKEIDNQKIKIEANVKELPKLAGSISSKFEKPVNLHFL